MKLLDSRRVFVVFNYLFLGALALLCLFPLVHTLALSFSASAAADAGRVTIWPVQFTTAAYEYAFTNPQFLRSFGTSIERVVLGVTVNMVLTILVAYPLSKAPGVLRGRTAYVWFFVITMLFAAGLVPTYMVVQATGLLDSIWALILPKAVPVFNVILLLNFFRSLPKELEEAAFVDGAGHWTVLLRIYLPLSKPALATITLFTIVAHWNSWFDGIIYMNSPEHYPLQSYLQTLVVQDSLSVRSLNEMDLLQEVSNRTYKAAQIFLAALPVLAVYPFLQRYFIKGINLGSVKG
ncbi:carbohydrate ABC transporter permease [Tenggerimyces flavus]|uniref:Carbohydrate ABC transporter permease n=1 Tax=Tenggerimyces flavus TaxID=1708749 RepID=A0ABV7YIX6_9ACTN|nr:carbohydrate ABC transporter permease [Tenggerimyces flavus]MBM7786714.1 putative aldouronate transport system permease protein [Tenggerimyces flavus]